MVARPREVVRFETLGLVACVLNLPAVWRLGPAGWQAMTGILVSAALILWVARGRSALARMLLSLFYALGLALLLAGAVTVSRYFAVGFGPRIGLDLTVQALNVAALIHLWSGAASRWLRGR